MRKVLLLVAFVGCAEDSYEVRRTEPPRRPWNEPREQLDKGDIVYSMQNLKPAVARCFDRYKETGMFPVALKIVGNGHVASVHVNGPHLPTNDCIAQIVATATFPPFTGAPQAVVYPFIFR